MTTCPRCGADLPPDFGMLNCAKCSALLFVDMEGEAHISISPAPDAEESASVTLSPLADEPTIPAWSMEPVDTPSAEMEVLPLPIEEIGVEALNPLEEARPDLEPQVESEFNQGTPGDPLGLNEFANSEMSLASDGPLLFKILISGIDAKEIRESVREALTDSKFGWDVASLMTSVRGGELVIEQLSPVKASVLINRIKRLPIEIRWEQYAVTQYNDP